MTSSGAVAVFGDTVASGLDAVITNPDDLDQSGWWAITQSFEGRFAGFRFRTLTPISQYDLSRHTHQPLAQESWTSSMSQQQYRDAVESIRHDIARGWVYQTNLCRILSSSSCGYFDPVGLLRLIRKHNPAPFQSALLIPAEESGLEHDVRIASASPELFLRKEGDVITTSPIKGTAATSSGLLEKDHAENVMIVDLMRNDLAEICESGSVHVPDLLRVEEHPGLVHLVSDVQGTLRNNISWAELLSKVMPPGSVSGAPKSSSLEVINRLEPVARGAYCGTLGWIDQGNQTAELAVGIRTFWQSNNSDVPTINFGTGAGITWASDAWGEWNETELKAARLLSIAAMSS